MPKKHFAITPVMLYDFPMALAQSKLTSQGQVSIPAVIRKKLGIVPGSVVEWDEMGKDVVVRRVAKYTSEDLHRAAFPEGPPPRKTLAELKDAIGDYVKERYGKR